ncbi:acyltransferase family protein [Schlesneria sp. T3-172]|uniref:acyltransferase family protein n=1 Tax=Schlesneria sphaerica TaxID=3373610 RepID=UPI0037C8A54F
MSPVFQIQPSLASRRDEDSMRPNNFDLIRLLAAAQVVYCHTCFHLNITTGIADPRIAYFVHWFPGVPIFFVLSGFLISRSWERCTGWKDYAVKRALRIYPGLWVQLAAGIVVASAFGVITPAVVTSLPFLAWIAAQASCVQFFNPDFLRGFGLGVLNGSLWTIPVELGFYLSLPLIYISVINRLGRRGAEMALGGLALASFGYWFYLSVHANPDSMLTKLQMVSPLPHLHMFLLGILIQRNFDHLRPLFENRAPVWLAAFATCMLVLNPWGEGTLSESPLPVLVGRLLLTMAVFSFAFSWRNLSGTLLRDQDLSYGVYLYHGLAINVLKELDLGGSPLHLLLVSVITVICAALSWTLVERPAVSRKPSHRRDEHQTATTAEPLSTPTGAFVSERRAA